MSVFLGGTEAQRVTLGASPVKLHAGAKRVFPRPRTFDGAVYLERAEAPALPITMACFVRPTSLAAEQWWMAVSDFGTPRSFHYLHMRPSTGQVAAFSRQNGLSGVGSLSGSVSAGGRSHVAGVWGGTASRIAYHNGVAGAEETSNRNPPLTGTRLGTGGSNTITLTFAGEMEEAALWAAALTPQQVADLAAGADPQTIAPTALWGYWPLGLDSPEPDWSGAGRTMTLN